MVGTFCLLLFGQPCRLFAARPRAEVLHRFGKVVAFLPQPFGFVLCRVILFQQGTVPVAALQCAARQVLGQRGKAVFNGLAGFVPHNGGAAARAILFHQCLRFALQRRLCVLGQLFGKNMLLPQCTVGKLAANNRANAADCL